MMAKNLREGRGYIIVAEGTVTVLETVDRAGWLHDAGAIGWFVARGGRLVPVADLRTLILDIGVREDLVNYINDADILLPWPRCGECRKGVSVDLLSAPRRERYMSELMQGDALRCHGCKQEGREKSARDRRLNDLLMAAPSHDPGNPMRYHRPCLTPGCARAQGHVTACTTGMPMPGTEVNASFDEHTLPYDESKAKDPYFQQEGFRIRKVDPEKTAEVYSDWKWYTSGFVVARYKPPSEFVTVAGCRVRRSYLPEPTEYILGIDYARGIKDTRFPSKKLPPVEKRTQMLLNGKGSDVLVGTEAWGGCCEEAVDGALTRNARSMIPGATMAAGPGRWSKLDKPVVDDMSGDDVGGDL